MPEGVDVGEGSGRGIPAGVAVAQQTATTNYTLANLTAIATGTDVNGVAPANAGLPTASQPPDTSAPVSSVATVSTPTVTAPAALTDQQLSDIPVAPDIATPTDGQSTLSLVFQQTITALFGSIYFWVIACGLVIWEMYKLGVFKESKATPSKAVEK
jgi:hypothetical protein